MRKINLLAMPLRTAAYVTVLGVYFHALMEWLFQKTSPSYFAGFKFAEQLLALIVTPLPLILIALLVIAAFYLACCLLPAGWLLALRWIALLAVPAFILSSTLLYLIDNFTYVVFHFGMILVRSELRYAYGLLFAASFVFTLRKLTSQEFAQLVSDHRGKVLAISVVLLSVSLIGTVVSALTFKTDFSLEGDTKMQPRSKPNIFLISGESLQVDLLSLYGYKQPTTPFLQTLARTSVVYENCFSNANRTSGSLASILTGRLPATTKKFSKEHVLRGRDAYEHLPGILKRYGYMAAQFGWPGHVDALNWNMKNAFDMVNGHREEDDALTKLFGLFDGRFEVEFLFAQTLVSRVEERLRHAFGGTLITPVNRRLRRMAMDDDRKIRRLFEFLEREEAPFFIQIHFDSTAGPPAPHKVIRFDNQIEQIVRHTKKLKLFENSIFIIFGDHGWDHRADRRLPLVIRYPTPVGEKQLSFNVQYLDLGPTLLEYMGIPKPVWMEGRSLFQPREKKHPIFSFWIDDIPVLGTEALFARSPRRAQLIVCDELYHLNLKTQEWRERKIPNHTDPCIDDASDAQSAKTLLQNFLEDRNVVTNFN